MIINLALSPVCVDKNGASPAKPGAVWALAILPKPSSSRGTTRLGDRAINFVDTKNKFETSSLIRNINKENINQLTTIQNAEIITSRNNSENSEMEELQTNILNSLNYASNQKLLPLTLPEQLNINFIKSLKENENFVFSSNPIL